MKRIVLALAAFLLLGAESSVDGIFSRGETLDYDLVWLHLSGGKARMTVSPQLADATKLHISSLAQSSSTFSRIYKVRDQIDTIVDRATFSTVRYHKDLREGSSHKSEVVTYANGVATRKGKTYDVPTPVFDPLSLVYYMRTQELSPGKTMRFTVFADKKLYDVVATVTKRETIETPLGMFKTLVVEPDMRGGGLYRDEDSKLTIWYTDDERHLPVRIRSDVKIGTITMTIRGVSAGVSSPGSDSK